MELKPQDVLVLLKVAVHPGVGWTYDALARELSMSASQVHSSVERGVGAGLAVKRSRGVWLPVVPTLLEFCVHGVRYAYPAIVGPVLRGIPTSIGAAPLAQRINSSPGDSPVWAYAKGTHRGPSLSPLYRTAPQAAMADASLYSALALLDALRAGRSRERSMAADLLRVQLSLTHAA